MWMVHRSGLCLQCGLCLTLHEQHLCIAPQVLSDWEREREKWRMWENEEEKSSRYHVLLAGALLEAAVEQNKQQTSRAVLPDPRAKKTALLFPSARLPNNTVLHLSAFPCPFHIKPQLQLRLKCYSNYMMCWVIHRINEIYVSFC